MPDAICKDCGTKGCIFQHHGVLVPSGSNAVFCGECFTTRADRYNARQPVLPLGETDYEKRCEGNFAILRFPDLVDDTPVIDIDSIAQELENQLKLPIRHITGSTNLCEFQWPKGADAKTINHQLNRLRMLHKGLAISPSAESKVRA